MAAIASAFPEGQVRIALIGKTGAGKSSTANTILGKTQCEVADGMSSGTDKCDLQMGTRDGLTIQVTDTPGVCDTHRDLEEVHREICKCVAAVAPGPHAILMCLRCDRRFTDEEYMAYKELKALFGEELVNHMILVFSGLDQVKGTKPDFQKIGEKIPNFGKVLQDLGSSDDRLITFNNVAVWSDRHQQSDDLLQLIAKMVEKNGGQYYSNDITKRFEETLEEKARQENKSVDDVKEEIVAETNPEATKDLYKSLPKENINSDRWCTIL